MPNRAFVIGYDISCPRRLQRVYREMCKHAAPLEYSVFLLVGSEQDKTSCLVAVAALINEKEDDVRCYPLPMRGFQGRIGHPGLPEGIQWTGLPTTIA